MKFQKLPLCLGMLLACQLGFTQDSTSSSKKKLIVTDVFLQGGSFSENLTYSSVDDFRNLAPESRFLNQDLSNFNDQASGNVFIGNPSFSASIGLKFRDEKGDNYRSNPLLRVGVSYFSSNPVSSGIFRNESFVVDTLVSTTTGETVLVDSLVNEGYSMDYIADQLRLDVSILFRTNPEARWSLYGGVGIAAGISINARTEISYYSLQFDEFSNGGAGSFENEQFNNQVSFGLFTYLPFGLDFRLGKNEFWKRTHLFYEVSPGLNMTFIPELNTATNIAIRNGLGLRVNWG
jgi:hypothetical protein